MVCVMIDKNSENKYYACLLGMHVKVTNMVMYFMVIDLLSI